MGAVAIRITFGVPLVALVIVAYIAALLIEWLGDLARTGPRSENFS
jgi:hypothetical protein